MVGVSSVSLVKLSGTDISPRKGVNWSKLIFTYLP